MPFESKAMPYQFCEVELHLTSVFSAQRIEISTEILHSSDAHRKLFMHSVPQ